MDQTSAALEAAAKAQRDARKRRDDLIRQRRAEGAPFRTIAAEAGLCHRAVQIIIEKSG